MAYDANTTTVEKTISGRRHVALTITETEAANGSEWSYDLGTPVWTIKSYKATLQSGSGNTINPILGRASGFSADTQDHLGTQDTTAAHINDQTPLIINLDSNGNDNVTLYGQSTVDTDSDNTIVTEILLIEGTAE